MNRRNFLKSIFATTAISAIPSFGMSLTERERCKNDIVYFVNTYLFDKNNKLKQWEEVYLKYLAEGKNFAVLNGYRLCGKTTMSVCYHVWRKIFFDENIYIISPGKYTSSDMKRFIGKSINYVPMNLLENKSIDFSYLDECILSESEFIENGVDNKKCKSIILDNFSLFDKEGKVASRISDYFSSINMDDVQFIVTGTPTVINNGFKIMCDAGMSEKKGYYFHVSTKEVYRI